MDKLSTIRARIPQAICCLWLAFLPGANASHALVRRRPPAATRPNTVPEARVNPKVVRLPIEEGVDLRFDHLSTAEGLSQTKVPHIVQDDQGFIWLGTQFGLNRFDGYKFRVFLQDPANANSLSCVYVNALFKDRSGNLWVGCDRFLDRFDPTSERFTHYRLEQGDSEGDSVAVMHISQDKAGILWLSTGKGLFSLDPTSGLTQRFRHDASDPWSLRSDDIKSTGEDREGNLWVANAEGLDEFDYKRGKINFHIPLHESLWEFSFHEDRFGVFWIAHASGNGLEIYDRRSNTLTSYCFYKHRVPALAVSGVRAIMEDKEGTVWLGTEGAGLLRYDRSRGLFVAYRHKVADPQSLAEDSVSSLFEDRDGNIWAGLESEGLERFSMKPLPFRNLPHRLGTPDSKGETFINMIYGDRKGGLWISTPEALHRIDRKQNRITTYNIPDVESVIEDQGGTIWAGTFNHGLFRFETGIERFETYKHNDADPHSLSSDIVSRLLIDHKGVLWAATWDGLNRFDAGLNRFTIFKPEPHDAKLAYLAIGEDQKGVLWLGTHTSGLQRFDPITHRFSTYQHQAGHRETLSDNRVNSIHFDRAGVMWIGTQNGLDKFDPQTGRVSAYGEEQGLRGNAIGCVLGDPGGNLWMSTNNGVSTFNLQSERFKNFSKVDGLPGSDLTGWAACYTSESGEMFFGGFSGGTSFYPAQIADPPYTPPVVFTDFRLFGRPTTTANTHFLDGPISYARRLTLSHDQSEFSLSFAALDYSSPGASKYRYKLESLDHDWNEVGSDQRTVTYTRLPPGKYRFLVEAATSRGPWSQHEAELQITILPPWWGTWWFGVIFSSLVLLGLTLMYRYRLRQLAHQYRIRLEERVAERTRIAQDLHDTLLQGFISASMQLAVANRKLPPDWPAKTIITDVLQLMKNVIEEGRNAVRGMRLCADNRADLEQAFSRIPTELALPESVSFQILVEGKAQSVNPMMRDEIYRIGREALINAFHHSHATRIEVKLKYADLGLRLVVRDNGQGIDPEVLRAGRDGHWGIQGMRERAERIGGQLRVRSDAGRGTEVELTLPSRIVFRG